MRALKWHVLIIACLTVILAPINYFAARYLLKKYNGGGTTTLSLRGADASAREYPGPTPPDQPAWPPIGSYSVATHFGHRQIDARAIQANQSTHSMSVEEFGWPLPVFVKQQLWWPWKDPAWKSEYQPERPLRTSWNGVILNPLMAAGAIWAVIALPWLLKLLILRAYRTSRRACEFCGYPRGAATTCSECGYTFTPSTHSAAPAPP
jgi:hypothetical protein